MSTRLVADTGRPIGTSVSRRLRREGKIPGVLYGRGMEPVVLAVDGRELRSALSTDQRLNAVLTIVVDGEEHMALAKDIQRHTTRHVVTHVDFLAISKDDVVSVDVPIMLVGEADLPADAMVNQLLSTLPVKAKPADIPASIEIDSTGFEVGTNVTIADLALPAGVTTDLDPHDPVVVIALQEEEVIEPTEPAEGEVAEGEEGAEGEGTPTDAATGEASGDGG
jgi:large subunit ribosomal protein L25